jgi:hypothetical protein
MLAQYQMCGTQGTKIDVDTILTGETEEKRPNDRRTHRWEDGTKMDIRDADCDCLI